MSFLGGAGLGSGRAVEVPRQGEGERAGVVEHQTATAVVVGDHTGQVEGLLGDEHAAARRHLQALQAQRGAHLQGRGAAAGAEVAVRQQRGLRRQAETAHRFGRQQGHLGDLLGGRLDIDVGVAEEQRAVVEDGTDVPVTGLDGLRLAAELDRR